MFIFFLGGCMLFQALWQATNSWWSHRTHVDDMLSMEFRCQICLNCPSTTAVRPRYMFRRLPNLSQTILLDQFGWERAKNKLWTFVKNEKPPFESCNFLDFEWKVGPCCLLMNFQKAKLKVKTKGGDTNGSKVEVREGVGHKCGKFHGVSDNKHHGK